MSTKSGASHDCPPRSDPELGRGFIFTYSCSLWKPISAEGKGRGVTHTADRITEYTE